MVRRRKAKIRIWHGMRLPKLMVASSRMQPVRQRKGNRRVKVQTETVKQRSRERGKRVGCRWEEVRRRTRRKGRGKSMKGRTRPIEVGVRTALSPGEKCPPPQKSARGSSIGDQSASSAHGLFLHVRRGRSRQPQPAACGCGREVGVSICEASRAEKVLDPLARWTGWSRTLAPW